MGSERESLIVSLQPGRWKGKSDKERTRKKLPEIKAKRDFKTPEMQDIGHENPETPACYN